MVRTLCMATMISRPRARARFLVYVYCSPNKHRKISRVCEAYNSSYTPLLSFCVGLHCCFSVLIHERPTLYLAYFVVSNCTKFGVLSRPSDFTILIDHRTCNPDRPPNKAQNTRLYLSPDRNWLANVTTRTMCGSLCVEPGSL